MTYNEWVAYGVNKRWVTLPVCDLHNGYPLTDKEQKDIDEGTDPCIYVMRIWDDEIDS